MVLETSAVDRWSHTIESVFLKEKKTDFDKRHTFQLLSMEVKILLGCVEASGTGNIAQIEEWFQQSVKKLKVKRGWLLQQDNNPK